MERDRRGCVRQPTLPCYYCGKSVVKMTRHLKEAHKNEQDVARAVAAGGRVLQRTMLRLKNSGVFKQNVKTLQDGNGTLIVCRRSDNDHIVEDYTPCPYCYTFVIKTELYRHCASCAEKPDGGSSDRILSATSATLLDAAVNTETAVNPDLREHILKKMRLDNVTATIKSDNLILAYGAAKYRKKGPRGYKYISSRMRLLGRLLIRMRSKEGISSLQTASTTSLLQWRLKLACV